MPGVLANASLCIVIPPAMMVRVPVIPVIVFLVGVIDVASTLGIVEEKKGHLLPHSTHLVFFGGSLHRWVVCAAVRVNVRGRFGGRK